MKFSSFYEFKKEQLPRQLYEEIRYVILPRCQAVYLNSPALNVIVSISNTLYNLWTTFLRRNSRTVAQADAKSTLSLEMNSQMRVHHPAGGAAGGACLYSTAKNSQNGLYTAKNLHYCGGGENNSHTAAYFFQS